LTIGESSIRHPVAYLLPLLCLFLAAGSPAQQQPQTFEAGKRPVEEIHVAVNGDDRRGDGSAASPYASIGRALQDAAAGTAIRIHEGTYPGDNVVRRLAGTAARPIWIGGAAGGSKPVIEGGATGFYFSEVRYLIVHDLVVRNTRHNGINTDDGGNYADPDATRHVIFRGIEIHDIGGSGNQDCLKLSGVDDYLVTGSSFARCGGSASGSGIDQVGCHDGVVQGNHFASMAGNAVQAKGGSENIRIHGNTIVDGGYRAVNIGGATARKYFRPPLSTAAANFEARNIRVTSNVIVGAGVPLAFVGAIDSIAAHNTIIDPERWLLAILQERTSTDEFVFRESGDNEIVNNLFYYRRSALAEPVHVGSNTDPDSFDIAANLWYAHDDAGRSRPSLPVDETNGIAGQNPRFRDPDSGDYRLEEGSPAIGRGKSHAASALDYNGRPFGNPPTIGAYGAASGG
jgi:hypothetical protein